MNKKEHINYWIKSSKEDSKTMNSLFNSERYLHSLFFGHLCLEKLLKALWVKNNENNIPPKTHNLLKLASESKIEITDDTKMKLFELNAFQLEGRYPDYLFEIQKKCDKNYTMIIMKEIEDMARCLSRKL